MKITVENKFYDGQDFLSSDRCLVSSVYASDAGHLDVIINCIDRDVELESTSYDSETHSRSFTFSIDFDWQEFITEVTITPETPEEIELMKGNRFDQFCKGQWVFKYLPWDIKEGTLLADWSKDV